MAAMCLAALNAGAQVRFGAKAGVSLLSADVRSVSDGISKVKSKDAGFSFGVMSRIQVPIVGVFVQPELMYNHAQYTITSSAGMPTKANYNNIEAPVMVGWKFLFLDMYAGPVFNLGTFGSGDVKVYHPNMGWQAGLGLSLFRILQVDARYHGYFSGRFNKFSIDGNVGKVKVTDGMWLVTVGHFF